MSIKSKLYTRISEVRDYVNRYKSFSPIYQETNQVLELFKFSYLTIYTRSDYLLFIEEGGLNLLREILSNWNKVKMDYFKYDESSKAYYTKPGLDLWGFERDRLRWKLCDRMLSNLVLNNGEPLNERAIPHIISSEIWRGFYDYKHYDQNPSSFPPHSNASLYAKTGIPICFWENPEIHRHMVTDSYLKDLSIPILTSDKIWHQTRLIDDLKHDIRHLTSEVDDLKHEVELLKAALAHITHDDVPAYLILLKNPKEP